MPGIRLNEHIRLVAAEVEEQHGESNLPSIPSDRGLPFHAETLIHTPSAGVTHMEIVNIAPATNGAKASYSRIM